MKEELFKIWKEVVSQYCENEQLILRWFEKIIYRYEEPFRTYHNVNHLNHLVEQINIFASENQRTELFFITFFHDVVYYPGAEDNELHSAEFADRVMNIMGIPSFLIQKVKTAIISTRNHLKVDEELDFTAQLFLDLDLAILGKNRIEYLNYVNLLRKEYASFSEKEFKTGRKKFIRQMLEVQHIYRTMECRAAFELAALSNLRYEYNT